MDDQPRLIVRSGSAGWSQRLAVATLRWRSTGQWSTRFAVLIVAWNLALGVGSASASDGAQESARPAVSVEATEAGLEFPKSLRRDSHAPTATSQIPAAGEAGADGPEDMLSDAGKPAVYDVPRWLQPGAASAAPAIDLEAVGRRIVTGTLVVLVLAILTLVIGRRLLTRIGPVVGSKGRIHVVETYALGRQGSIKLITVDEQRFLLAVDGRNLKTLVPLNESFASALGEANADSEESLSTVGGDARTLIAS